jgi:hypothetical protein
MGSDTFVGRTLLSVAFDFDLDLASLSRSSITGASFLAPLHEKWGLSNVQATSHPKKHSLLLHPQQP